MFLWQYLYFDILVVSDDEGEGCCEIEILEGGQHVVFVKCYQMRRIIAQMNRGEGGGGLSLVVGYWSDFSPKRILAYVLRRAHFWRYLTYAMSADMHECKLAYMQANLQACKLTGMPAKLHQQGYLCKFGVILQKQP